MARQGLPAHHGRAPARRLSEVVIAILLVMALRERRHSADSSGGVVQAAEYVRMSTDHQQYSTENQHAAIQRFADAHGIAIVRSFIAARAAWAFTAVMHSRTSSGQSKAARQTSARSLYST